MIFIFESLNFVFNFLIFLILCISARNSSILKPFQVCYLAFAIIIWLLLTLYHILKLSALIIFRIRKNPHGVSSVPKYAFMVHIFWIIVYGLAFLFMFVGFIYDIAMIINGKIAIIIYPVIYFVICFVYIILSFFDYIFKEKAIYLIIKNLKKVEIPKNSVQDDDELRKSDENENVIRKSEANAQKEPEKIKEE